MTHRWPAALLVVLGITSCAQVPIADAPPGERPAIDTDEAGIWQAMDRDEYRLRTSTEVIRDPALQAYLQDVLCRVAPAYCEDIRLYVLPSRDFNAAMAPNGMMLVFTGLLIRLASEAELAAVLGHEVAHYQKRHSLQRFRDLRSKTNVLQATGAILSAGVGVAAASANAAASAGRYGQAIDRYQNARMIANVGSSLLRTLELYTILSVLEYSREQEAESDHLGIRSISEAGYPPDAAAKIWMYMMQENKHRKRTTPTYLRTHPTSEQRQKEATLLAKTLDRDQPMGQDGKQKYMRQIAPFRNDWLHRARQHMSFDQERALIERQRDINAHPALVAFHEAQMYRRRSDPGDMDRALSLLQLAVKRDGCPVEAWRELGMVLLDVEQSAEARSAFERYLELAPEAVDAPLVLSYLDGEGTL